MRERRHSSPPDTNKRKCAHTNRNIYEKKRSDAFSTSRETRSHRKNETQAPTQTQTSTPDSSQKNPYWNRARAPAPASHAQRDRTAGITTPHMRHQHPHVCTALQYPHLSLPNPPLEARMPVVSTAACACPHCAPLPGPPRHMRVYTRTDTCVHTYLPPRGYAHPRRCAAGQKGRWGLKTG